MTKTRNAARSAKTDPQLDDRLPGRSTKQDEAAIKRLQERRDGTPPSPCYEYGDGQTRLTPRGVDEVLNSILLADTFATANGELCEGLLHQLNRLTSGSDERRASDLNFLLSAVRGIGPGDETEALLAVQMAAIHKATLSMASQLQRAETIDQQNSSANALNKLARTFALQLDALKRYRTGGEQTIKVQHVTVENGGQAIVGNVNNKSGGGGDDETRHQSHEPGATATADCSNASRPAVLSHIEADRVPMPGPGTEKQEGVPLPRRARRGA